MQQLNNLRMELRCALIADHERYLKRVKLNHYSQSNKASKSLANQLRQRQNNNKISRITHHTTGNTHYNPQEIEDSFADYYKSFYNLQEYKNTLQPTPDSINDFLKSVNLPKIDPITPEQLKEPISRQKFLKLSSTYP